MRSVTAPSSKDHRGRWQGDGCWSAGRGERIRARFIINNGDIRRTFSEMVPSRAVPEEYARRLQQSNVSESVFSVYLGVDMPPEEIPTQGCGHVFTCRPMRPWI